MKKLLKFGVASLSLAALGFLSTATDVHVIGAVLVHANDAQAATIPSADLGVSLGSDTASGETLEVLVDLNQGQVKEDALAAIKQLRADMWEENPPFNEQPLQEAAAAAGLADKEAYVNAINWDTELEKKAIQRTAELAIVWGHVRPDGTKTDIGFENIAMGYSTKGAVSGAWGTGELPALIKTSGNWNGGSPDRSYMNGHLHNQLNPSVKAFAVATINGYSTEVLDWSTSGNSEGTGLTGQYSVPIKVSPKLAGQITISLEKTEYTVGETVKPTVVAEELSVLPAISDTSIVGEDFVAKSAGTVTFTVAGKSVTATIVDKPADNTGGGTTDPGNTDNTGGDTTDPGNTDNTGGGTTDPGNTDNTGGDTTDPGNTDNTGGGTTDPGNTDNTGGDTTDPGNTDNTGGGTTDPGNTDSTGGGTTDPGNTDNTGGGTTDPGNTDNTGGGTTDPGNTDNTGGGTIDPGNTDNTGVGNTDPGNTNQPGSTEQPQPIADLADPRFKLLTRLDKSNLSDEQKGKLAESIAFAETAEELAKLAAQLDQLLAPKATASTPASAPSASASTPAAKSTPTLPKTGDQGTTALMATGFGLLLASLGLAKSRKED